MKIRSIKKIKVQTAAPDAAATVLQTTNKSLQLRWTTR